MEYNSITTLNEIREHFPCLEGWEKLLSHLGKTRADDEPLHLITIMESNGLNDAIWCLRAKSLDRLSRHFQAWCAEQVLHHFKAEKSDDRRIRDQIEMLKNDDATAEQRSAAWAGAADAARDAMDAASGAWDADAWATAGTAARAAAWSAAWAKQERQLRAMIGGVK